MNAETHPWTIPAMVAAGMLAGGTAFPTGAEEPPLSTNWDLAALESPPAFRWLDRDHPIHSLIYSGEPYRGQDTEVFAFYASPATIEGGSAKAKPASYPAVVLIHGGGGTAFSEWVHLWARRGYAAIAMDLSGRRPPDPAYDPATGAFSQDAGFDAKTRTRLDKGGPDHGHPEKFDSIGGELSDDWPMHAVASVIRAHSLVRSFPEVDPDRTAVTGISWGGYTTCLVASVDSRFRAAVPVYGCGFLHEGESVQKKSIDALDHGRRSEWIRRYDPSSHLGKCRVPILFVNGTNDIHYPLDSYAKSIDLVPGDKLIRIEPMMRHGHQAGWAPEEIGRFIDSHCRQGLPLPRLGALENGGDGSVRVTWKSAVPLVSASLHFTTDPGPRSDRKWQSLPAVIGTDFISAPAPPSEANTWFLTATDERGAMVSTPVAFSQEAHP